jgi:hypothetical protein
MILATLEYCKVCARWVPQVLIKEPNASPDNLLNHYEAEGDSFLHLIIGDETWCYHRNQNNPWSGNMQIPHQRKSQDIAISR